MSAKVLSAGQDVSGPITSTGTITANGNVSTGGAGDLIARPTLTGGGNVVARNAYLGGSLGGLHIFDSSGNDLFSITGDAQPETAIIFQVLATGVNGLAVNLATGGVALAAPGSSLFPFLKHNDGTVNVEFFSYSSKAVTIHELHLSGSALVTYKLTGVTFAAPISATGLTVSGPIQVTQVTSPANLTASQNNWAPTTPTQSVIRVTANASLSITGLLAGAAGQRVTIFNVGSNSITIAHASGSSTAANQFVCPGLANLTFRAGACIELWYDGTSSNWRVMGV